MKIDSKICWLALFIVGLMTILLPRPVLAQEGQIDLSLTLVCGDSYYYKGLAVGKDNLCFLEVRNIGTRPITNIRLSSEKPEGWVIEFRPAEIDYLGPGNLQTVDVNIKPDSKAVKGEYRVTIIAEANVIRKVTSTWVRIQTPTSLFWLWVGIGVAIVVVAGFIFIYMRFGRQK